MSESEEHAQYIIQSVDNSFREVCGRIYTSYDKFSSFATRVLYGNFPFVIKETAANILSYVAWDVNRFSAQDKMCIRDRDFTELHKEKLALIFENIDILNAMKESDTQLPPRFFREITDDVIFDYKAKIGILNKNTKFVTKELIKDFRLLRREQKRRQAEERNKRKRETILYVLPVALLRR